MYSLNNIQLSRKGVKASNANEFSDKVGRMS